jgi:outer membrane protein assembly factor BamB
LPPAFDVASGAGIRWKAELELPGTNSPIVWGDNVLLSGATEDRRCVYCYAASSGELRWETEIPLLAPEPSSDDQETAELTVNEETGYAAPTMATDGVRVFVMFAHGDVTALDFTGKIVWTRSFGTPHNHYGHASSLVVDETQLIVQLDHGSSEEPLSKLMALDCRTGKTLWSTTREVPASWSTPLVIEHENEKQIITCANPWVIAYRASDGEEIWRCDALYQDVGPSPIADDGVLYVANENPGGTAIRLGGSGDVTDSHVVWMIDFGIPDTTSPLLVNDMLLMLPSFGTLTSYDIATGGDPLWEVDFDDSFRSSPTLIGEHVLLIGVSGKVWLITVNREGCKTVMQSDLGEKCLASPAVHGRRIFIRGQQHLFCVGES